MSNVYVYEQGAMLKYKENRLIINYSENDFKSIPIENIDNIVIFGAIQVSTKCVQQMLTRGVNLTILSKNGSYFGRLESTGHVNINRQRLQFRKSDDKNFSLNISKRFIKGKVANQRTILMRANKLLKSPELTNIVLKISVYSKNIDNAKSIEELMGIEGHLAKMYYKGISNVIDKEYSFSQRTKRPPKDPFNSVLSFGYTLLHYEIFTIVESKGLNPYAGFLHSDRHKHPALCSDLMEEWRPMLVDSLAIALLNNNKIKKENFEYNEENGGVYLDKEGCKKFIAEFEKRLRQEVGYVKEVSYKMSFRRIIEYQIMQLIKAIEEDNPNLYSSILIR